MSSFEQICKVWHRSVKFLCGKGSTRTKPLQLEKTCIKVLGAVLSDPIG